MLSRGNKRQTNIFKNGHRSITTGSNTKIWKNVLAHQLIMKCTGLTMLYAWMPVSSQDEMIYIPVLPKKGPKKKLMEQSTTELCRSKLMQSYKS
jgi:hypothetical protein